MMILIVNQAKPEDNSNYERLKSTESPDSGGWRAALRWGFEVALLHRLLLALWMALVLVMVGGANQMHYNAKVDSLPPLETPVEQALFGIWRRWDAMHYFNLTVNGYRASDPGPTVFGLLTPLSFGLADRLLPGELDLAAMVVTTLAFGLALSLLYRLTATYFDDVNLARWALLLTVLLPLSYFFAAPMSEIDLPGIGPGSLLLRQPSTLILASGAAALATLARSQGVFMAGVIGLFLLQAYPDWRHSAGVLIHKGWSLALIPLAFLGYEAWRASLHLPALSVIYRDYSYVYLTNPIDGVLTNLSVIIQNPVQSLTNLDRWTLVLVLRWPP